MMLNALPFVLAQANESQVILPGYFLPVFAVLMIGGALGWLIAAVLGFGRAKSAGSSARWFALAAACLFFFHVQMLVMGFASLKGNAGLAFPLVSALNLFILLAAICSIIGFRQMPAAPAAEEESE